MIAGTSCPEEGLDLALGAYAEKTKEEELQAWGQRGLEGTAGTI